MPTTPSMTTPSIEEGTAHNPIFLSDAPNTSINVQPTQLPGRIERNRGFGNEIQNLPEYVFETLFERFICSFLYLFIKIIKLLNTFRCFVLNLLFQLYNILTTFFKFFRVKNNVKR